MKPVSSRVRSKYFVPSRNSKPSQSLKEFTKVGKGFRVGTSITSRLHRHTILDNCLLVNAKLNDKYLGSIRRYGATVAFYVTLASTSNDSSLDIKREWITDRPPSASDAPAGYYIRSNDNEEISPYRVLNARPRFLLITGADGSGKTTRLLSIRNYGEAFGYSVIYLPLPLPVDKDEETFWKSVYRAIQPPIEDLNPFSNRKDFLKYLGGIKGDLVLLVDDIDRLATVSRCIRTDFFAALNIHRRARSEFRLIATGTLDATKLGRISDIRPFNPLKNDQHAQVPSCSRSKVEDIFHTFQNDDHFILDSNVVDDIWLRSGGHPATVCFCGQFIRDRLRVLFDDQVRHISLAAWKRRTIQELYQWIGLSPAYNRVLQALQKADEDTIFYLRYHFLGNLDLVPIPYDEGILVDSLTTEGILVKPDIAKSEYRMASAFVDGFVRQALLSTRYPIHPDDALPVIDKKLVVFDAIKQATRCFDWYLVSISPPRQGLYDTELARIFTNWTNASEGWSATNDWHSGTVGLHSYITIKKERTAAKHTIVIAVLATRDAASARLRVLGLAEYKELMGADEAWLVQYSREDDYEQIWQSSNSLEKGVNVVYFEHDSLFKTAMMSAQWRDAQGQAHHVMKEDFKIFVMPPR
ncbi:hypothetical protein EV421DRAFT_1904925 [Armillaria borealis]|uniref:ORC1/DEAH AAA+ ATPase domain-containing protein n=1 Tax=Armillaria borealis TaxID=47425 RepID=A0AA39JE82_9AGAR|nr:hypothetical protein EV421DRAFT_1904925 [Armillaria borealis]